MSGLDAYCALPTGTALGGGAPVNLLKVLHFTAKGTLADQLDWMPTYEERDLDHCLAIVKVVLGPVSGFLWFGLTAHQAGPVYQGSVWCRSGSPRLTTLQRIVVVCWCGGCLSR